jgi:tetratricopeptide (TPR) repeat protein
MNHILFIYHQWRAAMARNNNNALGKGLKALIRDKDTSTEKSEHDLVKERHARNMEFYGSLMKKYISSNMEDDLLEEMLLDVRKHMGITHKEHQGLLKTLKKRENIKQVKEADKEKARSEIKEELAQIYQQIHGTEPMEERESRFLKIEREIERKERNETIQLSNGRRSENPKVAKVIKRRLVARNLDDRAGIVENGRFDRKRRLEWLDEEEEKPIKMTAPKKGLEDSEKPIKTTPPRSGIDDDEGPILATSPKEGLEDSRTVIKMKAPSEDLEDEDEVIITASPSINIEGKNALEMPPSTVPAGPGPGFELVDQPRPNLEVADEDKEIEDSEVIDYEVPHSKHKIDKQPVDEEETDLVVEELESNEKPLMEEIEEKLIEDSLISLKMLMEEGNIHEASDMADRLLHEESDNLSILNEKGVILYNLGDVDGSLDIYRKILQIDPDSVETLINYATLLSVKGELDQSLQCLDRAVKRDPYSEDAWNNKAVVFTRAGRLREALECLDEALRINEKTPATWMNAGIVLEKMGEIEPAMECYKNLLDLEPDNEVALQGLEYCRSELDI